jgi:hypothetical protein
MISAKEVTMECVCLDNNEQPTLPPVTLYCLLSEPNLLISIRPTITITSLAEVFPVPLPSLVPFLFLHFGLVSFSVPISFLYGALYTLDYLAYSAYPAYPAYP